jgi:photosystem II stability/assembly factor-like uncharacterized protein
MKKIITILILHYSFLIFNCLAQQPSWEIIPSGTTEELNSIFFYDYEVGFACGDSGTVIKSIDSGKTWQILQTPVTYDLNDLYMFHRDTIEIVGDGGTMLFSTDGGSYWWVGPYFITEDYFCVNFSGGHGICGGSSQTILWGTYTGTALYWMEIQSGFFGGGFYGAYMLSPQIGFVAGENSIFQPLLGRTTDSGINWDFTAFYLNNNEGRATGVDFTDLNIGYVSAKVWDGTGAIAKTTDSGSSWTSTIFTNPLWSIDFPISGASLVGYAVGDQGTILKTNDAGMNWLAQQSGTIFRLNKVHFNDFDFGFAVGENGIILKTTTGGDPIPVELTSFTASVQSKKVYLSWSSATEKNNQGFEILRRTQNDIDGWNKIGFVAGYGTTTETQHYSFTDNDIKPGKYQYRLKQIDFDGSFEYSDIIEVEVSLPTEFSLEQNYPNPFNPSTTLSYQIPELSFVTIKVYDVLGNEIAALVNEEKPAGSYDVKFSVGQNSILSLSSGIYFYKLQAVPTGGQAGNFVETKKMVLIK